MDKATSLQLFCCADILSIDIALTGFTEYLGICFECRKWINFPLWHVSSRFKCEFKWAANFFSMACQIPGNQCYSSEWKSPYDIQVLTRKSNIHIGHKDLNWLLTVKVWGNKFSSFPFSDFPFKKHFPFSFQCVSIAGLLQHHPKTKSTQHR